jgi:hypothetical protein
MKPSIKMFAAATLAVVLAAGVHAQHALTGKWHGKTPNGFDLVMDLTVKETTLSGTITREGQTETIRSGKVSKNTFSFTATVNKQPEVFNGELDGDVLKVWLERQGPDRAAVLKRVKD